MCCKWWWVYVSLLGLCVAGALLRHDHVRAQPPEVVPEPVQVKQHQPVAKNVVGVIALTKTPAPVVVFQAKVEAYGEGDEDAAQHAVSAAADKVVKHLESRYGETFTEDRLRELPRELTARGIVGEATFETKEFPVTGRVHEAFIDVKLTDQQEKEIRKEAREDRQKGRMRTAALALAGLMALLLVGGGYLRLEEATRGYYTTLLRVAALGTLSAAVAALLFVWVG